MTTVAITACTGMLGSMVYRELRERYELVLLYRDEGKLDALRGAYGDTAGHRTVRVDYADLYRAHLAGGATAAADLEARIGDVDAVVNTAGVVISRMLDAPELTFFLNGALPHLLAGRYRERLIHITTDCVYSGKAGAPYDESASATPKDLYGLTKSIGEPMDRSMVLRTSMIGPELLGGCTQLLEWLRSRRGTVVDGYVNHFWNGVTTRQLARSVADIVEHRDRFPAAGLFHVFSDAVSKYDLLGMIDARYRLDVTVSPQHVAGVDRRLATVRNLNADLGIPPLQQMIEELA